MSDVIKICGIAFIGLVSVSVMRGVKNEFSSFVSVATGVLLIGYALSCFYPLIEYVEDITKDSGFSIYTETILKAVGIAVVTETAADICRDFGESAIAAKVELAAKSVIMLMAMPVVQSLLALAFGVLR